MEPLITTHGKTLKDRIKEDTTITRIISKNQAIPRLIPKPVLKEPEEEEIIATGSTAIDREKITERGLDKSVFPSHEAVFSIPGVGLLKQYYHDVIFHDDLVVFGLDIRWKWGTIYIPLVRETGVSDVIECTLKDSPDKYRLQYFSIKFEVPRHNMLYIVMANVGAV